MNYYDFQINHKFVRLICDIKGSLYVDEPLAKPRAP